MSENEILVVGAGPVGLTMAAELTRHGVKCRIIDRRADHAADSRAAGIHARTMEVFEDMGIVEYPLKHGVKVTDIHLYSHGKELMHAKFKKLDTRYEYILDMPQSLTEPMLITHLKRLSVEVERNVELTEIANKGDRVEVKLGDKVETFSYVVGCDGAGSTCRRLLEIPFPGEEYPSSWAVFDAKLIWPYQSDELYIFFHEEGVCAFFPLPEGRMRITCELLTDEAKRITEISYEDVLVILKKRISKDLQLSEPKDLSPFILHHRQAKYYRQERVFLAGDAAHVHSPAGGQGMNTGIQDAYNLAWKLALVHKGLSPESLLDSYHDERHPIGEWVLNVTDKVMQMVGTRGRFLSYLRNASLSVINHIDALKLQMPKNFSQLYLKYKENSIIQSMCKEHRPKHLHAGERAPDHTVKSIETGDEVRLFELLKGTHFTLLLFSGNSPSTEESKSLKELFESMKSMDHSLMRTFLLVRRDEDRSLCTKPGACFLDQEPSVHSHYGIERTSALLIRPDGYVGLINQPPSSKACTTYLAKILIANSNLQK